MCRRLADRLGINISWVIGYQPLQDLVAAIAAADALVLPYRRAGQSGLPVLAQAVGTPTVGYSVGALSEALTISVPANDERALAEAIDTVVDMMTRPRPTAELTIAVLEQLYG